ncbi:unnamed protein product [Allacma fusca]|uniref:SCP domain-containing protein n=1 Tax=Allacma fusca TaxID=39272 RepID=A0A8J2J7A7_9HEXA|nr:unnamed protein product [Allacma fusca]
MSTQPNASNNVKSTPTALTTEAAKENQKNAPRAKVLADKAFLDDCLNSHNFYRRKHKSPDLELDDDLCQVAQAYVTKLAKSGDSFQYSGNGFGENIFFTTVGPAGGKEACEAWYSESRNYDWDNIDKQKGTSHFTQMIWKGTTKLGMAMATSKHGIYVVAEYSPPGNVVGRYPQNIAKPEGKYYEDLGGSGGGGKGAKDGNTGGGSSEQAAEQMKNAERVKSTTDPKFIQEALEEHNKLRASHGIGPVSIDEDLNNVAQAWANRLLQKGKMEHSTNGFGENVFWASGGSINGAKPCQAWYSEIKDFDFNRIDHTPGTGHFTQLLWKGSDKIGIALASGKAGHFVVANYNPPGNFLGQYAQNIYPIQS